MCREESGADESEAARQRRQSVFDITQRKDREHAVIHTDTTLVNATSMR